MRNKKVSLYVFIFFCSLFTVHCSLFIVPAFAQESIDISAEQLEYDASTHTYTARGSANIVTKDAVLNADEISLNTTTSDAVAAGNVYYEDTETIIKGDRIELNLETKLGTIYNGYIFYKDANYHLRGGNLRKLDEKSYFLDRATVTTCDADPPEWYVSGKDIKAVQDKNIKARDTAFYIKDIPIFYTPYFWMPLTRKRQTGLLVPSIGSSTTKGFMYKQGFFWAIKENKDATFYLDYFSEKGFGKGLEYRYIVSPDTHGKLWVYHLKDNDLLREFLEIKSYHNIQLSSDISGYLTLHTVNTFDYYSILGSTSSRESHLSSLRTITLSTLETLIFDFELSERLQKYLESNLYLSKPFYGGRTYILGQYRQSLEGSSEMVPQSLPEIGLILNTRSRGNISFNMAVKGTNLWREDGQQGQRLDINPNLYFSYGKGVNLTQRIGLRETAYLLNNPSEDINRLFFDLSSTLSTRFFKRYSSFIHTIEPSLEYAYIPAINNEDAPLFDSIDPVKETSSIVYSLTNRFEGIASTNLEGRFRVSQRYNLLETERPFTPLLTEGGLSSKVLDLSINTSYDFYETEVSDIFATIRLKNSKGYIGVGKDFRRSTELDQYTFEGRINSPIWIYGKSFPFSISARLWYDLKNTVIQESSLTTIYKSQCWALTASIVKRPEEYQITFGIEFIGLGALRW